MSMRLGILGSTRGTHLGTLIAAINKKELSANIAIVLSNKADAFILERAAQEGLPHQFVNPQGLSREDFDAQLSALFVAAKVDYVILIGYMRILSSAFVAQWPHKILNVHPSLLPAFSGLMDLAVHEAVLAAKVPESGCTVHYVIPEVDAGPIILQKKCTILSSDTPLLLKKRIQSLEGLALIDAINSLKN